MELEITLSELQDNEYGAVSRLNSKRYPVYDKIKGYIKKSNQDNVYTSLKDFLLVQEISGEKVSKNMPTFGVASYCLATTFATKVGIEELNYNDNDTVSYFTNKAIDFRKGFPSATNNALDLYLRAMEETKPVATLEAITDSFYRWLLKESSKELLKYDEFKNNIKHTIIVANKKYQINLEISDKPKRQDVGIDLSNYFASTTIVKEEGKQCEGDYIYGHDEVKQEFEHITTIVNNMGLFTRRFNPKRLFQNYILIGPPGTGKTTLINTLADRCGLKFARVPCVELCSKYFSESSTRIHGVYQRAREVIENGESKGVIIFLDEFDQIAKRRGTSNSSENDSMTTTLNENLDGGSTTPGIITFAATNHDELIDPAVLNKFTPMYIGYPNTDEGLIKVHSIIIRKINDYAHTKIFEESLDYNAILQLSKQDERYKSGRIIDRVLHRAAVDKTKAHLSNKEIPLVTTTDILEVYYKLKLDQDNNHSSENISPTIALK